nr:hypothetical protein [Tanacetum cinerariifolium]
LEISTQADGAQSPRVLVPFPEDPYEAIGKAYLVEINTESKPFEDPVEFKTPESPHAIASPTLLPDSTLPTHHAKDTRSTPSDSTALLSPDHPLTHTTPTLVPSLRRTASFCKRFRSSYESSLSSSSPDLSSQKRSRGTSELVEDHEEGVEEGSDPDSESEDDEGPGIRVESLGLGGDEAVPKGQQQATPIMETAVGKPLGLDSPATTEAEGFLTELGAQVEMQGWLIHDHTVRLGEVSPVLFERSLEHEHERITVTFEAIWRPVLALKAWLSQTDA